MFFIYFRMHAHLVCCSRGFSNPQATLFKSAYTEKIKKQPLQGKNKSKKATHPKDDLICQIKPQ